MAYLSSELRDLLITAAMLENSTHYQLLIWNGMNLFPAGCDVQLWSAAYPVAMQKLLAKL